MNAHMVNATLDAQFKGRLFQVVSVASNEALTEPKVFSKASDDLESFTFGNGICNGVELAEVKA